MGDEIDVSNYRLRQLRSAAAKDGRLDKAVIDELAELEDEHRLYVFRPETRCRVCTSDASDAVNKMLAHAMTYRDILRVLEPINAMLPQDRQITYNSINTHAKRHFPIQDTANAVYRRIIEKRAEEYEVDYVRGVGGALTPLAYLDVMMTKGFETMAQEGTRIDPADGMRAAEKIHALTREKEEDPTDVAEIMLQFNRLVDAVKSNVDPAVWPKIIAAINDESHDDILEAEVDEDYEEVSGYDPGDPDFAPEDPEDDDGYR